MSSQATSRRTRIEPIYRPQETGEILVYAGPLAFATEEEKRHINGQLEMRLFPRSRLVARYAGPLTDIGPLSLVVPECSLSVPAGNSLAPPSEPTLPERPQGANWAQGDVSLPNLEAGSFAAAEGFLIHVSQSMQPPRFRITEQMTDGSSQGQIDFQLGDWSLVLAPVDPANECDFGAVVEATRTNPPVTSADIDQLARRLFFVLSLLSSGEVGIGPLCGLDGNGELVWAEWQSMRLRPERSSGGWCSKHLVPQALPALAAGYTKIAEDAALEQIVQRAIEHLLSAEGSEVLDVRVPVACAGLELLSWALLRRDGWVGPDTSLKAGAAVRMLVRWAGLPANLPEGFDALAARRSRLSQTHWGAPELLFNVRNGVMHPPRTLSDPEWPTGDELFEAWQLATEYLQLVILRVLGYQGEYWSRLRLGRSDMDVETVPWVDAR